MWGPTSSNYAATFTGGNVGIGTTNPSAPLTVSTTAVTGNIATFVSTGSGGAGCSIAWNGTSCSSDIRLKKDIHPLDGALDKLLRVEGVSFVWKKDPEKKRNIGFIAQELEKVFPELVTTDANGYRQVNYANFVAVLANAVKEVYAKVTAHDTKLAAHDAELADHAKAIAELQR